MMQSAYMWIVSGPIAKAEVGGVGIAKRKN
jgi:hypothetical protein